MKKLIAITLILVLALSLTACGGSENTNKPSDGNQTAASQSGGAKENKNKSSNETAAPVSSDTGTSGGIYKKAGSELTDFFSAYDGAIDKFEGPVNKLTTEDFDLFDITMDYLVPSLQIAFVGIYDSIEILGISKGEYKETNGNIITFGKKYTRDQDGFSPNDIKGDVVVEEGVLDTSANTLSLEAYIERDGEKVHRAVTEAVMLPDGSFLVQTLMKTFSQAERGIEDTGRAYFIVCGKDKLEVIKATFPPDVNFTYGSIAGKGKITSEDMAEGYEKVRKLTVFNDEASAEKY